jgi:hypothetical protein
VLKRAFALCLAVSALAPAAAHATGVFEKAGPTVIYKAEPGDVDQIAAFETPTTIRFTRFGGAGFGPGPGCSFLLHDFNTIDCTKDGVTSVVLDLGDGDDVASIDPSLKIPVIFNGADGRDGLFGGGGTDIFDAGPGDDNVISRDDRAEDVRCGDGHDTAIADDGDARGSCEEVQGDADLDGVRFPADCDDTNPGIHPGAADVPDNGVDEDCSGIDATELDRDHDGLPRPQDCDDTNGAIKPGAREVLGNAVDENCDGVIEPYPPLVGSIQATWKQVGASKKTRNVTLVAKGFPASAQISVRCTGVKNCPKATAHIAGKGKQVDLHDALGTRSFSSKARIEVQVSRADRMGRVLRFDIGTPGLPEVDFLCKPPDAEAAAC